MFPNMIGAPPCASFPFVRPSSPILSLSFPITKFWIHCLVFIISAVPWLNLFTFYLICCSVSLDAFWRFISSQFFVALLCLKLDFWMLWNNSGIVFCTCLCTALGQAYWAGAARSLSSLELWEVAVVSIDRHLRGHSLRCRLVDLPVSH